MRVTIYQPRYFPQLHYFNRIFSSDAFVILESTQYTKSLVHNEGEKKIRHKSFQSDTPINSPESQYLLTVPLRHNGLQAINKMEIDYMNKWNKKHILTINNFYRKAPNFDRVSKDIESLLTKEYSSLAELNNKTILWGVARLLGNKSPIDELTMDNVNLCLKESSISRLKNIYSDTELGAVRPEGSQRGTEWTTAICKELHADEYMHGETAKNSYMEEEYYEKNGIKLTPQKWMCKEYKQLFLDKHSFLPNLSIIDLLFNVDTKTAQSIIGLTDK